MPLGTNRKANTRTLKNMMAARRRQATAAQGALGGIEKRHAAMLDAVRDMRVVLEGMLRAAAALNASVGAEMDAAAAGTRPISSARLGRLMTAIQASTDSTTKMSAHMLRTRTLLGTEEQRNEFAAEAARNTKNILSTFCDATMREVNEIGRDVTHAYQEIQKNVPLRADSRSVDPQGRVVTTLFRISNPDRSFNSSTDTLFARRRGSGARRPNLPGTLAARARAHEHVTAAKPEATLD